MNSKQCVRMLEDVHRNHGFLGRIPIYLIYWSLTLPRRYTCSKKILFHMCHVPPPSPATGSSSPH